MQALVKLSTLVTLAQFSITFVCKPVIGTKLSEFGTGSFRVPGVLEREKRCDVRKI